MRDVRGEFGRERTNTRVSETLVGGSAKPRSAPSTASEHLHEHGEVVCISCLCVVPNDSSLPPSWNTVSLLFLSKSCVHKGTPETCQQREPVRWLAISTFCWGNGGAGSARPVQRCPRRQPVPWEGVRASRPPPLLPRRWEGTLQPPNRGALRLPWKKICCPTVRFWCHYSWE